MIFAFEFQLTVEKLTGPAAAGAKSVDKLTEALKNLRKAGDAADGILGRVGVRTTRAFAGEHAARAAKTNMAKIADEWQRMEAKAAAAEARATRAAERESAKRIAARERESKASERMWTRMAFAAQKAQDKAADAAARKPWFGGHKSVQDLLSARATAKVSGMATSAADSALGLPGALLGGIGGLALSGVSFAANAAIDLAKGAAGAAVSFAEMAISAQSLREQSVAGFQAVYGSKEVGERLFEQGVRIAKLTKFDTPDVVATFNTAAANKFRADELNTVFAAYADVASMRGSLKGGQFLRGMSSLKASPAAYYGAFKQAAFGGPGEGSALEALADRLGLAKDSSLKKTVMGKMRRGEISSSDAQNALLDAVQQTYNKKEGGGLNPLGTAARAQGEGTWEGLISNIRNGLSDVLTMKLPEGHPMLRFKDILVAMNRVFDETTENGRRFQALVSKLVEDVFLIFDLDSSKDKSGIEKAMSNVIGVAEVLEEKLRAVSIWIRDNITKPLFEGLSGDVGASLAGKLKNGFIDLGITLGKAVAIGMFDAMGLSGKAAEIEASLKEKEPPPPKTPAQIQADQYEAERAARGREMGLAPTQGGGEWSTGGWQIKGAGAEQTADAMGLPKMARGGDVYEPTIALVGERGPERVRPMDATGGVNITGGIHIHMPDGSMSGNPQADGQAIGLALMSWLAQQGRNPSSATMRGA